MLQLQPLVSAPDVVPDISTSEAHSISSYTPSMSSGDKVIWCFATQDICTDVPSIPADTVTMSTSAGVITIDETLTMSSGTPAISTGNAHDRWLMQCANILMDFKDTCVQFSTFGPATLGPCSLSEKWAHCDLSVLLSSKNDLLSLLLQFVLW